MSGSHRIIDCHVHLRSVEFCDRMVAVADLCGIERIGIVCTINRESVNANAAALACKAKYPDRIYAMLGLDHSARLSDGKKKTPSLADQVEIYRDLGADGLKMIEGKPTTRKYLDVPVDDPYFAGYFAKLEETQFPVVWHVNDPEEFWDPEKLPDWAAERNWGYDDTDVQKEAQYAEVERVLEKHPGLNLVFAHFYFLSADLPRAAAVFDKYPRVHFDLAPGIEMLYNTADNVDETREFFIKYADRIVFGTDLSSGQTDPQARHRAGIVYKWLESGEEFRVTEDADFLLGKPEDGRMCGMALPEDVLKSIYWENFERIVGGAPKTLDKKKAAEECRRVAAIAEKPDEANAASGVLEAD